jgi:hypothetical protein
MFSGIVYFQPVGLAHKLGVTGSNFTMKPDPRHPPAIAASS